MEDSTLGFDIWGAGPRAVVLLNDWLCDTSTWDPARCYLDTDLFRWIFTDLRGYGRSRSRSGSYTLQEAANDVLTLADALKLEGFAIVGHSMSTLVALHLGQMHPERVTQVVLLTPPPPTGLAMDSTTLEALAGVALGDDARRMRAIRAMGGGRLSEGWVRFKAERWRVTSDPQAVLGYLPMFGRDGVPHPSKAVDGPLLAVTGEEDAEVMRAQAVTGLLSPLCSRLSVVPFAACGHYPMQEMPPLLVQTLERFLL